MTAPDSHFDNSCMSVTPRTSRKTKFRRPRHGSPSTFFQQVLVVANTVRKVDGALIEAAQALGANRRQFVLRTRALANHASPEMAFSGPTI